MLKYIIRLHILVQVINAETKSYLVLNHHVSMWIPRMVYKSRNQEIPMATEMASLRAVAAWKAAWKAISFFFFFFEVG